MQDLRSTYKPKHAQSDLFITDLSSIRPKLNQTQSDLSSIRLVSTNIKLMEVPIN